MDSFLFNGLYSDICAHISKTTKTRQDPVGLGSIGSKWYR